MTKNKAEEIGGEVPTNGAKDQIAMTEPYFVSTTIEGTADMLLHAWNCESVTEKANAARGSRAKKTDDVESYVRRNDAGDLCIPGEYLRGSVVAAAKYMTDPRSTRKSLQDLAKAAVVVMTPLATLGVKSWDYLDTRRAVVNRSGINRTRPAMKVGWKATFDMMVVVPEYFSPAILRELVQKAGKLCGLGDFRPTYGRFDVVNWTMRKS